MNSRHQHQHGVALVVVLWVVVILSLLIGGFAFSMYVETQVASYARKELKAAALARSGVELARLQLLAHGKSAGESQYESLDQKWASNDSVYRDHELGDGHINITVTDEERRISVNQITEARLRRLMRLLDMDMLAADTVTDSILDWITPGDLHRINGAKKDFYNRLPIPHGCKNAPLDRIEELLMIHGVTPELYNGTPATTKHAARPGFKDLFTTAPTGGRINVNTASSMILQAVLNIDATHANSIVEQRNGPDGIAGTDDDQPFHSVDEFLKLHGPVNTAEQQFWQSVISVKSANFRIISTGDIGGVKHTVTAILVRTTEDYTFASWNESRTGQPEPEELQSTQTTGKNESPTRPKQVTSKQRRIT